MGILDSLEPTRVFQIFEEMCAIPHGSGNTKAISDWCVAFAQAQGLEYYQDTANNVIIIQEATPGYEAAEPVILQGHLDMVCEKEAGCEKDMAREGLDLVIDGDGIRARGTTLGGDDGIAVAMILAIMEDTSLPHPRLEGVFTTEEEIGMLGAQVLDVSPLQGRKLLNLDSEDEGVFTVGCAGGSVVRCRLPLERINFSGSSLTVSVHGLIGGHSGAEIHRGRANAVRALGRVLQAMAEKTELRIAALSGGGKDNAIPTEASACVQVSDEAAARAAAEGLAADLRAEYQTSDPGLRVEVTDGSAEDPAMDAATTSRVLCMLNCLPNGIQAMSMDIPGLVQTSLNLGILSAGEREIEAVFCLRSSVASQKRAVQKQLRSLMEQLGGCTEISGDYPAWEYRRESPFRELLTEVYREQYGQEPVIEAIHAGLECGVLAGKLPGLDCVSIGPDLTEIHTPRERMSIPSVQRVWRFVLEVLRRSR